jgi:hypothetical protein
MMLSWVPARMPSREPLAGESVILEPVNVRRRAAELFESSAGADSIWDYLAYGPFPSQAAFTSWLEQRAA